MHPILATKERLQLYLALWLVASAFLSYLFTQTTSLAWWESSLVIVPIMSVYAFVCLATWYVCRSLPLSAINVPRFLLTFGFAGSLSSSLFVALGRGWSFLISNIPGLQPVAPAYREQSTLLFLSGIALFSLTATVHYLFIALEHSAEAERHALELRLLAQDAELRSLRAQIDPHFLFNSLNSISALTTQDPAAARRMILLLADFFRNSITLGARTLIKLEEELAHIDRFVAVEQIRFGSRLNLSLSIDAETKSCLIPPLLLQPLVENSIKHGIAPLIEGGTIRILSRREGHRLLVEVENPYDADSGKAAGSGLGLQNVSQRLQKVYEGQARLDAGAMAGSYSVRLLLPIQYN